MDNGIASHESPSVAIIVPVYNDENYIRICLDSIKNQTVPFWEVWLTDDCSTDKCGDIMKEYCNTDSRFHYLRNEINCGQWKSRARGILSVSPSVKYIMFADADDSLQPNAVERVYALMEESHADILHFGTNVENFASISGKRIQAYSDYLNPPLTELKGRSVFESFAERKFEGHLWNKAFNAELIRSVINKWGTDRVLYKAEDKALYWAICWHKNDLTYRGSEERLYNYSYGKGLEGGQSDITLEQYKQYLDQSQAESLISEIMEEHSDSAEKYTQIMEKSRLNLINNTAKGFSRLLSSDKPDGLDMFSEYWTSPLDKAWFTAALAEYTWETQLELAEAVSASNAYTVTKKGADIRVIGTYYHRLKNGGIENVITRLVRYWHELGYEIVLFTDFPKEEDDYEIPEYVTRADIGYSYKSSDNSYFKRGISFSRLLNEYHVDCMVYHSHYNEILLYEMLLCKSLNIPFILHTHNTFSLLTRKNDARFASIPRFIGIADGIICLDDASAMWWKHFNRNVHTVLNPLTFNLSEASPAERNNHNILFLCRLSENDKHPHDAVTVIRDLVKIMPDAKLYMVGEPESERYLKRLNDRIAKLKLENNVILTGYTKEVEKYYKMCSVFLICSPYEGFCLTLCEALSFNIPVVMYELPYLAVVRSNPGLITVKQRDTAAAVKVIYELFNNRDKLIETGDKGRKYIEELYRTDISAQWREIFNSIGDTRVSFPETKMMCDTLINDYREGASEHKKLQNDFKEKRSDFNKLQAEYNKQTESLNKLQDDLSVKIGELNKVKADLDDKCSESEKLHSELNKTKTELEKQYDEAAVLQADLNRKIYELGKLQAEANKKSREINDLRTEFDKKCSELNRKNKEIKNIRNSLSFKIGRFFTFIPRKIRAALRKLKK
ncbi:MAG: glycosyltransferase [Bacteroides sp.]|nr:glycosyltransferase [Bacteroides sp.]